MTLMTRLWTTIKSLAGDLLLAGVITLGFFVCVVLVGCDENVPKDDHLQVLNPLNGNRLEKEHTIDGMTFVTTYDTGEYSLSRWRITDSKVINMSAYVRDVPEGTEIFVEHVHVDCSLKSSKEQLDGLSQDSMDDSYHGTSQDGFYISPTYSYQNVFAIEGFSKDLISGWQYACSDYGIGGLDEKRLTEKTLVKDGGVYANKMQVVYDLLIKNPNDKYFHTQSFLDEFLIPTNLQADDKANT